MGAGAGAGAETGAAGGAAPMAAVTAGSVPVAWGAGPGSGGEVEAEDSWDEAPWRIYSSTAFFDGYWSRTSPVWPSRNSTTAKPAW
ncbi:hypothetical protein CU669_02460 [Paramagnetospirillum kuznetsovii]|uniref:Uncharacterized protein n=1 Tax=Paramagnetospirillum kuznetsovii TaxID=2053833 RepID=A0A364P3Q0_9PROT|nr:hypothetical protein CU669_02460 [Paramagnetospirillum kuznetsovii]